MTGSSSGCSQRSTGAALGTWLALAYGHRASHRCELWRGSRLGFAGYRVPVVQERSATIERFCERHRPATEDSGRRRIGRRSPIPEVSPSGLSGGRGA